MFVITRVWGHTTCSTLFVGGGRVKEAEDGGQDCNKSGQDMDTKLLLLRLERLSHLKIAAGVASNHSVQLHLPRSLARPTPPPFWPTPLSSFLCVFLYLCRAHVRIFYGSKKTTPKWQAHWCACGNVNWGVYKLLSALAHRFLAPAPRLPSDCFSLPPPLFSTHVAFLLAMNT